MGHQEFLCRKVIIILARSLSLTREAEGAEQL